MADEHVFIKELEAVVAAENIRLAGQFVDITAPDQVEVEIRADGSVLWVHVEGITKLRLCRIQNLTITDRRDPPPDEDPLLPYTDPFWH
jgi:hypothetical protein